MYWPPKSILNSPPPQGINAVLFTGEGVNGRVAHPAGGSLASHYSSPDLELKARIFSSKVAAINTNPPAVTTGAP